MVPKSRVSGKMVTACPRSQTELCNHDDPDSNKAGGPSLQRLAVREKGHRTKGLVFTGRLALSRANENKLPNSKSMDSIRRDA